MISRYLVDILNHEDVVTLNKGELGHLLEGSRDRPLLLRKVIFHVFLIQNDRQIADYEGGVGVFFAVVFDKRKGAFSGPGGQAAGNNLLAEIKTEPGRLPRN